MDGITLVPVAGLPPMVSALVWRPAAAGPRLRAFVSTAADVLNGQMPAAGQAAAAALLEPAQPAPRREQRLLERILRVVQRAQHPVAVHQKLAPVGIDELCERLVVAGLGPADQVRGPGAILSLAVRKLVGRIPPEALQSATR